MRMHIGNIPYRKTRLFRENERRSECYVSKTQQVKVVNLSAYSSDPLGGTSPSHYGDGLLQMDR